MQKLTIITINKNNRVGLERTHRSIIDQLDKNFTWIVIDGNSDDGSLENVIESADKVICEDDDGIYYAMNKGLEIVKDSFIIFLNSGDELFGPETTSLLHKILQNHDNETILFSDIVIIGSKKNRIWHAGKFRRYKLYFGWHPPHPGFIVHSSLLEKYHTSFDTSLQIAADYHFMVSLLLKKQVKVKYLKLFTVNMESGGVSNASLKNVFKANLECAYSWRAFFGFPAYWITITKPLRKLVQFRISYPTGNKEN